MKAAAIYSYKILLALAVIISITAPAKAEDEGIKLVVYREAKKHKIDPDLVLAIMEVESGFNKNARGKLGEIGLLQLRPEFHDVRAGDTDHNIAVGVRYLAYCRNACLRRYGSAFFVCFNRGPYSAPVENPKATKYYKRVITIYKERKEKARSQPPQLIQKVPYIAQAE